jgi:polyisoprenoid-binding protein YceI
MATTQWTLDPIHSEIGFKIKHMMFTNVSGKFSKYNVNVSTEGENFETASITFEAAVDSISTNSPDRDKHLISPDFFDATQFPKISFTATSFRKQSGDHYQLVGDLDMHGITKPVQLDVEFSGLMKDPWGNVKVGFNVTGKLNRKQWGLNYNAVLESGGILLGEEVKVEIELQLQKKIDA